MIRGSISLTFPVKRVVKAATKPNSTPKSVPPKPTTKKSTYVQKNFSGFNHLHRCYMTEKILEHLKQTVRTTYT